LVTIPLGIFQSRAHLILSHGEWEARKWWESESASNPLVGFRELNDNIIKGLTSLLSVEQEI
jgi:hypothetical protein